MLRLKRGFYFRGSGRAHNRVCAIGATLRAVSLPHPNKMTNALVPLVRCAAFAMIAAASVAAAQVAHAAAYPAKPLRLVTGSAPGGGSDFVARALAEKLSERFGQQVLVDNRPGAGGAIGADVVAKANPEFKNMARVNVVHVPYRGSAPAAVDLIAGQVQLAMNNIVPTLPHVKSGRLRALGVSGPLRSPVLPEVPTVAEAALPGYEAMQWYGVLLPAKVPKPIAALLHREISAVLQIPIVRTRLTEEGGDVVGSTPEQFAAYIALETAKWARVVKMAGVKAE